jgi:hypothetical protein
LPVRLDHEVRRVDALGDLRRRFLGNRYQPASLTQHVGRPRERVAADRVEHEVDGLDASNERRCRVEHLLGPEFARELSGAGRRGAGHMRPSPRGELGYQVTDAAGRTEDEDALAGLQLSVHEEALPRRQPGQRQGGALDVAQAPGLWSEERGRHDGELGGSPVAIEGRQSEHLVADGEVTDVAGDFLNDARELVRHDRRQAVGGPVELVTGDGRRVHAHEGFPGAWLRNLDLVDGERADATRRMQASRAHHRPRSSSRLSTTRD